MGFDTTINSNIPSKIDDPDSFDENSTRSANRVIGRILIHVFERNLIRMQFIYLKIRSTYLTQDYRNVSCNLVIVFNITRSILLLLLLLLVFYLNKHCSVVRPGRTQRKRAV